MRSVTASTARLASVTDRPERFIGLHFMNPVPVMPLVEVVRGERTSERTMALARGVADLYLPEAPAEDAYVAAVLPEAELQALAGVYRDERRGEPLRLVYRDGALRAGNTALNPLGEGRFRAGSALIELHAGGFRWIAADGDTLEYTAEAPFDPSVEQLGE